jgi:PPOX class probable F420-dependent enzyme
MGVQLNDEEIEKFLGSGHTLIVATIRKSGEPFMVPVWYIWRDGAFHVVTFADSSKARHLRRDPRACCMVEDGEKWIDLRAVVANCDATMIDDPAVIEEIGQALRHKYADFRAESAQAPVATKQHYARKQVVIRLVPRAGELRSWYNRKLRMPK